jgi:hypothetical protein
MSGKKHVTALGVPFDMAAFRAKNEKVRAVGNMNVNARGDVLDSNNNIIENRNKIVNRMYEKTMQSGARPKRETPSQSQATQKVQNVETSKKELDDLDDDIPNPKK